MLIVFVSSATTARYLFFNSKCIFYFIVERGPIMFWLGIWLGSCCTDGKIIERLSASYKFKMEAVVDIRSNTNEFLIIMRKTWRERRFCFMTEWAPCWFILILNQRETVALCVNDRILFLSEYKYISTT